MGYITFLTISHLQSLPCYQFHPFLMIFQLALIHILVPIKEVQLNQYKGRFLKVWLKLIQ